MRAVRLVTLVVASYISATGMALAVPSFTVSQPLSLPRTVVDIAVGDLNNDNIDDVAVISRGTNKVSIVLVQADGTFRQGASLNVGSRLKSVGIGDFNGDDIGDIVVATGSRNMFIIPGRGDGTFSSPLTFRRCCPSGDLIVGDFDQSRPGAKFGDDIAVSNPSKDDVSVIINNNGTATELFKNGPRLRAGNKPQFLIGADFTNDGLLDIAALNILGVGNDVSTFINQSQPGNPQREVNFRFVANFFAGKRSRSIASGEISRDSNIDMVTGDQRNNELVFLNNLGGGLFGTGDSIPVSCVLDAAVTPIPCKIQQLAVADFDQDNSADVAVMLGNLEVIRVFTGSIGGGFSNPTTVQSIGRKVKILKLGNFNGDSRIDMAVIAGGDNTLRLILNTSSNGGGPTFTNTPTGPTRTPTPTNPGGTQTPSRTPTECRGQGCPCDPLNGDADCNVPFFCAEDDEVCCDTPCNDLPNLSCDIPGSVGTCLQTDRENGDDCVSSEQCQSGFCVDGVCCDTACDQEGQRCDSVPGMCLDDQTPRSTPTFTGTPTNGGAGTATPTRTPTVRLRELGEDCTSGPQCRSTFCPLEDLVCCESACNGANEQCDLPGVEGFCLPINLPDGEDCLVDGQCQSAVCENSVCTGGLPTRTPTPPNRTVTPTSERQPTGAQCTNGNQCQSGFCPVEDGVCCNTACDGASQRCDIPGAVGRCLPTDLPDNQPCEFDQQCISQDCNGGFCAGDQPPPTIGLTTRSPTPTRTATPPRSPVTVVARGSGCSVGESSGGLGSAALLLAFPLWWLVSTRVGAPARRRRRTPRR